MSLFARVTDDSGRCYMQYSVRVPQLTFLRCNCNSVSHGNNPQHFPGFPLAEVPPKDRARYFSLSALLYIVYTCSFFSFLNVQCFIYIYIYMHAISVYRRWHLYIYSMYNQLAVYFINLCLLFQEWPQSSFVEKFVYYPKSVWKLALNLQQR